MLADVVAKRTRCDGPTIIEGGGGLVPSIKSEEDMSPPLRMGTAKVERPRLVEQGVLERTGGKRLTVDRDAVKEALDILDRAVGRGQ
jgi:AP-1-like factor